MKKNRDVTENCSFGSCGIRRITVLFYSSAENLFESSIAKMGSDTLPVFDPLFCELIEYSGFSKHFFVNILFYK